MRAENFDVDKLIEYLQGTSNTMSSALDELHTGMTEEDLTKDELAKIDDEVFVCDNCGWYCETSERFGTDGNGDLCADCDEEANQEDREEDDDE